MTKLAALASSALLTSLLFSLTSFATPSVDVFSSFDTPGYNEIDACGNKTGFEIELTNAIFASQNYSVNWLVRSWDDIVADLGKPSGDKNYIYIASIEGRASRRANWLFANAIEFDASHYFIGSPDLRIETGDVLDSLTGKTIPGFVLDVEANRLNGNKLRIATWKGSAFDIELNRIFVNSSNIEILAMEEGDPLSWLSSGKADLVYVFASGPKNSYADAGYVTHSSAISNFDIDRFGGTSPALPLNSFGQEINRVWSDGFAAILRDDTFFEISMKWFGRVSWPEDLNSYMITDIDAFRGRIARFERTWIPKPDQPCQTTR